MVKPWPIEINGLPINSTVIFHGELLNNQCVSCNNVNISHKKQPAYFAVCSFFLLPDCRVVSTFHIFHQHSESGFWTLQLRHGRILHVVELLVLSQIHRTTGIIQIHDLILYFLVLFLQFGPQIRGFHPRH